MEAPPEPRHRVLDARGNRRVVLAFDQAVALEIAELLGEHALAHPGNQPAQLGEAKRPAHDERVDDRRLPLAGDDAHDGLDPLDFIHSAIVPILYRVTKMCLLDFVYQVTLASAPVSRPRGAAMATELVRPRGLLIDAVEFRHRFGDGVMAWRDAHIIPRYGGAGIRKFAFQMPSGFPNEGKETIEGPAVFPTKWFVDREKALSWLRAE